MTRVLAVCAAWLAMASLPASASEILGVKPGHVWGGPSSVPNEQAMDRRIWVPGIDDGYVPQGLAFGDGALFVSSYRSTDTKVDRGPCRVYKVDPSSGKTLGQFDLPPDCGHAGGLAWVGKGVLVVADTRRIYRIDAARAFGPAGAADAVTATVSLRGALKGAFADSDGTHLLLGSFDKDAAKSQGHFVPLTVFDTHNGKTIGEGEASRAIPLPVESQGAVFDRRGGLWTASSSSRFGMLYRLDPGTGAVESRYEMVIGIEDLAFDEDGRLWSVSEAGSLRWSRWGATFPLLFRMDPSKLSPSR